MLHIGQAGNFTFSPVRDIKHNLEETTKCRQWNVRDGMHKQKCGVTMNSCNDVK